MPREIDPIILMEQEFFWKIAKGRKKKNQERRKAIKCTWSFSLCPSFFYIKFLLYYIIII